MSNRWTIKQTFTFSPDHNWPYLSHISISQGRWKDAQVSGQMERDPSTKVERHSVLFLSFLKRGSSSLLWPSFANSQYIWFYTKRHMHIHSHVPSNDSTLRKKLFHDHKDTLCYLCKIEVNIKTIFSVLIVDHYGSHSLFV